MSKASAIAGAAHAHDADDEYAADCEPPPPTVFGCDRETVEVVLGPKAAVVVVVVSEVTVVVVTVVVEPEVGSAGIASCAGVAAGVSRPVSAADMSARRLHVKRRSHARTATVGHDIDQTCRFVNRAC